MENAKHKVIELSQTKVKVEVEVSPERVKEVTEKVFGEIQHHAAIKGFRPGKAPINLVREKYLETARQHITEDLINATLPEILKEKNINPVGSPVIEKINFDFEKPFSYSVTAEFHPKITSKNYKGLKLKKEIKKITEKEIDGTVEELRKMNTKLIESPDKSNTNSCVIINYTVHSPNKKTEYKELNAENQLIDLTEKQALQGLAEGLLGVKKGDKREVFTKIPDSYPKKELAGGEIVLNLEVKEVKNKILPELNDDFAREMGAENTANLRKKIKERLTAEAEKNAEDGLEEQLTGYLLESNKVDVPESLLASQKDYLIKTAVERIKYQGVSSEIIEKQKNAIEKKALEESLHQLKLYYIMNSIAEQEKIDITEEEYNQKRAEAIKSNPGREKFIEQYFREGQERLISRMKTDKIFKFLKDNAKIKVQEV